MRPLLVFALLLCASSISATDNKGGPATAVATNSEMTSIYEVDQNARKGPKIDVLAMVEGDRLRRAQTQALIDTGKLNSADDYYHAAFVFQHGDLAEDCLKAHALAVVAAAKGKSEAAWIAAATLDRYLQRIGQPQIYGTQFLRNDGEAWTQEPYRKDLLSDAIRQASGVQTIAKQHAQLEEMTHKVP